MRDELISDLYKQLNISEPHGVESLCKAIYSATGKLALASLWDHPEEPCVSIQHFKKRATQVLDAYLAIYPKAKFRFPEDRSGLIEDIYETYRRNGFFYYSPHHLSPAAPSIGGTKQCVLYRGASPETKLSMSGLGMYGTRENPNCSRSAAEMFGLKNEHLTVSLQEALKRNNWMDIEWPEDTEFLRLNPPFSKGYWQNKPDKTENISMARYGAPRKLYVFYRWKDGHFEQKPIPAWRIEDYRDIGNPGYGEYRSIACGLLEAVQHLPPVTVKFDGSIAQIKLGYRLPPAEEDFFKLYSWPVNYDIAPDHAQVFQREMSKVVYPIFKEHLQSIGYCVVEG